MDIKDQNVDVSARAEKARDAVRRQQKLKNWALAGLLVALAVLFYFITIVRFGNHG
jgi:hypothetical protein